MHRDMEPRVIFLDISMNALVKQMRAWEKQQRALLDQISWEKDERPLSSFIFADVIDYTFSQVSGQLNNEFIHLTNYKTEVCKFKQNIGSKVISLHVYKVSLQEHELFFEKADINSLKSGFKEFSGPWIQKYPLLVNSELRDQVFSLLCLLLVFDAPEHEEKKKMVLCILTPLMNDLPYQDLEDILNQYTVYILLRKSKVTLCELDIMESNPSLELRIKLCVFEKLLQHKLHVAMIEFLHKYWTYFLTKAEIMMFDIHDNETRSKIFNVLLHFLLLLLKSPIEHQNSISKLISMLLSFKEVNTISCYNLKEFSDVVSYGCCYKDEEDANKVRLLLFQSLQIYEEANELERCIQIMAYNNYNNADENFVCECVYKICRKKYCNEDDSIHLEKFILDINKYRFHSSLLNKLTEILNCLLVAIIMKTKANNDKTQKNTRVYELLVLLMLLLMITSIGQHKSAKLKKYLTLKYEYDGAILYLLWCSGNVEKNPGPPVKKRPLCHASERKRKWMHDVSPVLLKCYHGELPKSKPKQLWSKKPDHWPSSMPFNDTKNKSQDESGPVISDEDLLKCLLECCHKKGICLPQVYQTEINAWQSNKIQLLYKLYVLRTESENIHGILQNLLPYIDDNDLKQNLKDVKVTLNTENGMKQKENLNKDQRSKGKTDLFADFTRDLAGILCRIVKGKDPEKKCDGIWKEAPEGWPQDVPFYSPYNRGKSDQKCSDHKLVATLLQNSKAVIPPKYKSLVDAYKDVMKAGGKKKAKKQKEILCKLYVIQTNISKLDYVLKRLQEEGLFVSDVNKILDQWWSSKTVDKDAEDKLSEAKSSSEERPDISINISPNFIRLCVYSGSQLNEEMSYCIPVNHLKTTSGSNSSLCYGTISDFNLTKSDFTNNQLQSKDIPCVASPICHDNKLENNKTLSTASESHSSASTTILGQSHDKEADTTYNCLDNVPGTSRSIEVDSSPVISDDQTEHSQRWSTIQSTEHSQRCSTIQSTTRKRKHSNDQESTENVETVTKKTKVRNIKDGQENVPSSSGHPVNILLPTDLDAQLINLATELNFPFDSLLVTDQASKIPTDLTEIPQPSELDKQLHNHARDPKLPSDNLLVSRDDSDLSTFLTETDYCLQSEDDEETGTKLENLLTDIINFDSGKESEIGRLLDEQL